jgi:GntR family transcriptional repressor for pyruvate dehydrogenase complex
MSTAPSNSTRERFQQFERVEQLRAHEYLAEQLRRQIDLRLVSPGQSLPSERALMQLHGVGRATVQQAMRQLEAEGRIAKRRGRSGGSFVLDRGAEASSELSAELRRRRVEIGHALDFRLELEPAVAAFAAERASPDARAALRASAEELALAESDNEFEQLDTALHLQIAHITGNPFFVEGVEQVRRELNVALLALPASRLWHDRSVGEHDALVSAIEASEPDLARVAMRVHITHTDKSIRAMLSTL